VTVVAEREVDLESTGERDTLDLGVRLGALLEPGDLVLLAGPLGAGKTVFARGIAAGLGVSEPVSSPSFALINEYDAAPGGRVPHLYHMDLYRLAGEAEVLGLGLEEYLEADGAILVEWPDVAAGALPCERLRLDFAVDGEHRRRIRARAEGERYGERLAAWRRALSSECGRGEPGVRPPRDEPGVRPPSIE
jgi:tRNA threonylcarbamoyladenosine biosynthesis protein TsaE